jgi:hypothetical protein
LFLGKTEGCGTKGLSRQSVIKYRANLLGVDPEIAENDESINSLYGVDHDSGIKRQGEIGPFTRFKLGFCDSYVGRDLSRWGDLFRCQKTIERFGRNRVYKEDPRTRFKPRHKVRGRH